MRRYLIEVSLALLASLVIGVAMSAPPGQNDNVTYIHLVWSGSAFVVRADTGQEYWVTRENLPGELARIKDVKGVVLYSREKPDKDPPQVVVDNFNLILDYGLPIKLTTATHPHATE